MMSRFVFVLPMLLSTTALAHASVTGKILIFSDAGFTDSTLSDNAPRIANLFIVHTDFDGATAVRFMTVASPGFTGVWLGETSSFTRVGKSTTGISVGYGACITTPALVLTVSYQFFGTSSACSQLSIAPETGFLHALCFSGGGCFSDLPCQGLGSLHVNCTVPVESTTWGRVKALYSGN